jgi:O-Antigen ligase
VKEAPFPPPPADHQIRWWLLLWGALLGLAILKFGNPVILERQIPAPASWNEAMTDPWPIRWVNGLALAVGLAGLPWIWREIPLRLHRISRWLWVPPMLWLAWQYLSSAQTEDPRLTSATLAQFTGVFAAYAIGLLLISSRARLQWVLAGVLAGFCLCLMRSVNQRMEFPQMRASLVEGERTGWTNFPPAAVEDLERQLLIVTTNGARIANPLILLKLERGRVNGTLVYPNALAAIVLLLLPVTLVLVDQVTRPARPATRWAALGLLGGLGAIALFWSGSKSGWLIALALLGAAGWKSTVPRRWKTTALALIAVGGVLAFALRFQSYFAAGATSVGARMDYWNAAVRTALTHPILGTGPGTFQRPYARLKAPESEMARLAHNDYLEQFSDSGFPGGLFYLGWIAAWLVLVGRRVLPVSDAFVLAAYLGTAAWLVQGVSEFGLYVPALAWTAFTLAGALAGFTPPGTTPTATPPRSSPRGAAVPTA